MWAGWSLFGRRAGMLAAVLFAFSAFLRSTRRRPRPTQLLAVIGLICTAAFLHAFVFRSRDGM